jgi:hypothetical protein
MRYDEPMMMMSIASTVLSSDILRVLIDTGEIALPNHNSMKNGLFDLSQLCESWTTDIAQVVLISHGVLVIPLVRPRASRGYGISRI